MVRLRAIMGSDSIRIGGSREAVVLVQKESLTTWGLLGGVSTATSEQLLEDCCGSNAKDQFLRVLMVWRGNVQFIPSGQHVSTWELGSLC